MYIFIIKTALDLSLDRRASLAVYLLSFNVDVKDPTGLYSPAVWVMVLCLFPQSHTALQCGWWCSWCVSLSSQSQCSSLSTSAPSGTTATSPAQRVRVGVSYCFLQWAYLSWQLALGLLPGERIQECSHVHGKFHCKYTQFKECYQDRCSSFFHIL